MYTKILVPLDGSDTSQHALSEAAELARVCGARIELLHVIEAVSNGFEPPEVYLRDVLPQFVQRGEKLLKDNAEALRTQGLSVETILLEGGVERVSDLIVEQAHSRGADLIVLGTHGRRGFNRLMMGSDAEQVARISPVPVMLVRPRLPTDEPKASKAA